MTKSNDDFIIGLVKNKLSELIDRMGRERPELLDDDRIVIAVRLARQEIAEALASRPDLAARFDELAAEHYLRSVAHEVQSLRSG